MLVGEISYGKLSFDEKEGKNPKDNPVSYPISYVVPPNKVSK
jgi:tripeptidyl-peptidase-2